MVRGNHASATLEKSVEQCLVDETSEIPSQPLASFLYPLPIAAFFVRPLCRVLRLEIGHGVTRTQVPQVGQNGLVTTDQQVRLRSLSVDTVLLCWHASQCPWHRRGRCLLQHRDGDAGLAPPIIRTEEEFGGGVGGHLGGSQQDGVLVDVAHRA